MKRAVSVLHEHAMMFRVLMKPMSASMDRVQAFKQPEKMAKTTCWQDTCCAGEATTSSSPMNLPISCFLHSGTMISCVLWIISERSATGQVIR